MKHISALTTIPLAKPERRAAPDVPHIGSTRSRTVGLKPDFFIVGAPKCGTTALANYLTKHPDIFMARKEMHFFGRDLRFASSFYRRAEPEYLAEFNHWCGQKRLGEASVWYLFSETAAAEIKAFNPEARIIVLLREPVDMMYSLFRQFRLDGNESLAVFQEALDAENDRRAGRKTGRQTYLTQGLEYRKAASFARPLQRYFDIFGRNRVLVLLHEDLADNPAAVYRQALEFLEVDAAHTLSAFPRINTSLQVKNRTLRALLNDPFVRSTLLRIRPILPPPIFYVLHRIERLLQTRNATPAKSLPLESELRSRLRLEFAPEVSKISQLIRRDLSHWSRETTANPTPFGIPPSNSEP